MGIKKSFLFYYDWENIFEPLDDWRKSKLVSATIKYAKYKLETEFSDLTLKVLFNVIRDTIDRDSERYDERCLKNSENGKKGGRPKKQMQIEETEKSKRLLKEPKKADIDIDTDIDRDIDRVIDRDIDTDNNISFSAKTACVYSEDFLIFWSEYPKKVGKGEAFKQWKKAKLSEGDKKDILTALKWQKKSDRWRSSNGRYIPNPATYISQRRWEDEPCENNSADITNPDRYNEGDTLPDFIMKGEF